MPRKSKGKGSAANGNLVESPEDYEHSSARYYIKGEPGGIKITTFMELQDIDHRRVPKLGTANRGDTAEKKS